MAQLSQAFSPQTGDGVYVHDIGSAVNTAGILIVSWGFWVTTLDAVGPSASILVEWEDPNGVMQSYNDPLGMNLSEITSTTGSCTICKKLLGVVTLTVTVTGSSGSPATFEGTIFVP